MHNIVFLLMFVGSTGVPPQQIARYDSYENCQTQSDKLNRAWQTVKGEPKGNQAVRLHFRQQVLNSWFGDTHMATVIRLIFREGGPRPYTAKNGKRSTVAASRGLTLWRENDGNVVAAAYKAPAALVEPRAEVDPPTRLRKENA